jgi:WD40 repeat protein
MSIALSPCGLMLACGTLLGQIYLFAAEPTPSSSDELFSDANNPDRMAWHRLKWVQIAVLHDFNDEFVEEFWSVVWSPDSSHIIASGSCKARHQFDSNDNDLKVLPSPLVVFNLEAYLNHPTQDSSNSKIGIRRYEGHQEEVVEMKLWQLPSTGEKCESDYLLTTCSQDGHVRKWRFDQTWKHVESIELKDEDTWMAFSAAHLTFPPNCAVRSVEDATAAAAAAAAAAAVPTLETVVPPSSLLLLAGDGTLKLFDASMITKLFTFHDLYDTYCTNVDIFTTPHSLAHPWRTGIYLNGDGYVYSDQDCSQRLLEEPPTFLVLTKGIDYLAPATQKSGVSYGATKTSSSGGGGGDDSSDMEIDDLDDSSGLNASGTRKSCPSRILLHVIKLPLLSNNIAAPSTKGGSRKTEWTQRLTVDTEHIELDTIYTFSHPLFESNYWPARFTHNGQHVLSVASNGTVFAWNFTRSNIDSANAPHNDIQSLQPQKSINASSHISSIMASHDEDLPVRDVKYHPYWPFLFTAGDDNSVHIWAPSLFDPTKMCSIPLNSGEPPLSASLSSIIVPKGANLAFSQQVSLNLGSSSTSVIPQHGSVYKSAIEAAMMASVGSLLPAVAKRRRGRPPKKKIIEEIEAQFAAQERALAAQQQLHIVNPQQHVSIDSTAPPIEDVSPSIHMDVDE